MPQNHTALPRETANAPAIPTGFPRETADADRSWTDEEHTAILAHTVAQETATLTEQLETLKQEKADLAAANADLEAKIDVLTVERDTAKSEHADFVANLDKEKEEAALKEERTTKLQEQAAALPDGFLSPERIERITKMDTAAFDEYIADLAAASAGTAKAGETVVVEKSAMQGATITTTTESSAAAGFYDHVKGAI